MIYIVALGIGLKCTRKIHLNTQCPLQEGDVIYGWFLSSKSAISAFPWVSAKTTTIMGMLGNIHLFSNKLKYLKKDFGLKMHIPTYSKNKTFWKQWPTVYQKVPKSDFQSEFSMSRMIQIFLIWAHFLLK